MKRFLCAVLCTLGIILFGQVGMAESVFAFKNGVPCVNDTQILGRTLNSVEKQLTKLEYAETKTHPFASSMQRVFVNQNKIPHTIVLWGSEVVEAYFCLFKADGPVYQNIYQNITTNMGEPERIEGLEDQGETLRWSNGIIMIDLFGSVLGTDVVTLAEVMRGKKGFMVIAELTDAMELTDAVDQKENETKPLQVDVEVSNVKVGRNLIGTTEIYVQFKNVSKGVYIDRVDFQVECLDVYGKTVKGYGYYELTECFFDSEIIGPKKTSSNDYYWTLHGFDGTSKVRIAIIKYHTTDGKTVNIPDSQRVWTEWRK